MKTMKKIATLILAVCLIVPCVSIVSRAASGKIQFTDPSTKTGETVEVTCAVKSDNGTAVGAVKVSIKYDTTMLAFKKGDGVQEVAKGNLSYSGTGTSAALRFNIQFTALKEGTTKLEVTEYTAALGTGETLQCTTGTGTVTIAKGTEVAPTPDTTPIPAADGVKVTVNAVEYTLSSGFKAEDVPEGFEETTIEYEGANTKFVKQATTGMYLGYLVDESGNGDFYIYNVEEGGFAPFEQIEISSSAKIVLLADASQIVMPEEYTQVSITVNNYDFPAWQHVEEMSKYILYAMNHNGQASLYQYDVEENTYQRFKMPEVKEEEVDNSTIGKIKAYVDSNFTYVLLIGAIVLVFFLVLVIVLGVKLNNRNLELDDLYDEYGIDLDEEPVAVREGKKPSYKDEEDEGIELEDIDYEDEDAEDVLEEEDEEKIEVEEKEDEEQDISLNELAYEDDEEDDFDLKFQEKLEESFEEEKRGTTMKKDDSFFEDFDFDLIDLDD